MHTKINRQHRNGTREKCKWNTKIFMTSGDMYGERIGYIEEGKGIASFRGNDYRALILTSDGQCGSVCDEDDLDL